MPEPGKKWVEKGSRCNNTAGIQNAINIFNSGRNNLKVDGIFGDNTESAIKSFQRACGLKDDGKVGDDTGSRLFDEHSLTQTLIVTLPANAFRLTGKTLPPRPLLDTAGALLTRQKAVEAWTSAARVEKAGIDIPKLELRHIGLQAASMLAHGAKQIPPLPFLQQLPKLDAKLPHTLQFVGETANFKTFKISYTVDKVLQPQTPTFIKPYFKNEFKPGFDLENPGLKVEFRSEVGLSSPRIIIGKYLEAGANLNLWTSAKGAIGLGGAVGELSGGAKAEARAIGHIFQSEFRLGPIRRMQLDAIAGFNLGLSAHLSFNSAGAVFNVIPPRLEFGPLAQGLLTVGFE